jgi:hypothetical protein
LHPSGGPLAAILPLFPRRLQFPIPVGLNLLLMPGEYVFGLMYTMALLRRTLLSEIGTPSTKCLLRMAAFSSGV